MPLFLTTVMTVVVFRGMLLGMVLGLLLVKEVEALRLKELIDFGTSNASNGLFCESVRNRLAFLSLTVLKEFCLTYN